MSGIGLPKGITVDDAYVQGIADTEDRLGRHLDAFIRSVTIAIYLIETLMEKAPLGFIERNGMKREVENMRAHRDQIIKERGNA